MPNKNSVHPATDAFRHRLSALAAGSCADALRHGLRGIERESLRVTREGKLAMTPHPRAFGSALTHPQITTDYSEALVELITDAKADSAAALEHLDTLHRFVYGKLGDELLWNDSMPCELPPDDEIPIGWYGTSNIGMLKYVYRRGLSLRYGRTNASPASTTTIR
jgi:glutamate--cysteine ligase